MSNKFSSQPSNRILLVAALVITVAVGAYGIYTQKKLAAQLEEARGTLTENQEKFAQLDELESDKARLEATVSDLQDELETAEEENEELTEELEEAEDKNEEFEEQIDDITETVSDISRYTSVDPELLKKYSRVYFLSENYAPSSLAQIDDKYLYNGEDLLFHRRAYPFLKDMLAAAAKDGVELRIVSAYRSFQTQQSLNDRYTVIYGADTANQFSAEQGYSEHQLGTTVDFTTATLGAANFTSFGQTRAFDWLKENAAEFGFILSYPKNNEYYQHEPWHWRFVGIELAEDLEDAGAKFYEWKQRRIDEYRGKIFQD